MADRAQISGSRRASGKRIAAWALAPLLLLLVPLVAMQFTSEVDWGEEDFIVMGIMLALAGGCYGLLTSRAGNFAYRAGAAMALGTAFLIVWSSLAVGIIGDGHNDFLYLGVLAVLAAGTVLARFRPEGLARALTATAAAVAVVAAIALASGMHTAPGASVREIVAIAFMFMILFLGAAGLFRAAALVEGRGDPPA